MTQKTHPLRIWRESQRPRISTRKLAEMLTLESGAPLVSYASLIRIELGHQPASHAVMRRINEVTGGEVRPDHFVLQDA